jgi:hypothetical protein
MSGRFADAVRWRQIAGRRQGEQLAAREWPVLALHSRLAATSIASISKATIGRKCIGGACRFLLAFCKASRMFRCVRRCEKLEH